MYIQVWLPTPILVPKPTQYSVVHVCSDVNKKPQGQHILYTLCIVCTQCFPHMTCQINKPLVQIFFDVVTVLELNNKFLLPPKEFGPNLYRQQRRNRRLRHNFSKHLKMVEVPIPLNYSVIRRMCLLIVDFQQQQVRK